MGTITPVLQVRKLRPRWLHVQHLRSFTHKTSATDDKRALVVPACQAGPLLPPRGGVVTTCLRRAPKPGSLPPQDAGLSLPVLPELLKCAGPAVAMEKPKERGQPGSLTTSSLGTAPRQPCCWPRTQRSHATGDLLPPSPPSVEKPGVFPGRDNGREGTPPGTCAPPPHCGGTGAFLVPASLSLMLPVSACFEEHPPLRVVLGLYLGTNLSKT